MPEMRSVYSSNVNRIGYDAATQELHVEWRAKKGQAPKVSVYDGVPAHVARQVMNAPSIGEALAGAVKGSFGHRYP